MSDLGCPEFCEIGKVFRAETKYLQSPGPCAPTRFRSTRNRPVNRRSLLPRTARVSALSRPATCCDGRPWSHPIRRSEFKGSRQAVLTPCSSHKENVSRETFETEAAPKGVSNRWSLHRWLLAHKLRQHNTQVPFGRGFDIDVTETGSFQGIGHPCLAGSSIGPGILRLKCEWPPAEAVAIR
jgi:hypothetical protein